MIWKIYSKQNFSPDLTREKNIYIQSYLLLFPSTSRVALYWASPPLARMYTHTHTQLHASSCLRVFAQGVSPPKIPSPSLSAHLHLSYPLKLCLSCIWSHRIIKLLPIYITFTFYFSFYKLLHHSSESLQTSQVKMASSSGWLPPQGPCHGLLLTKLSNHGEVLGCAPGQSPRAWSWRGLNSHAELCFCPTSGFYRNSLSSWSCWRCRKALWVCFW